MPVAIIISPAGIAPAVLSETSGASLLMALRSLTFAPDLPDEAAAREWLMSLPDPSGWFEDMAHSSAYLERLKQGADMLGSEVRAARKSLGLSQEALAEAIGIGGNANTRSKRIWEVEEGRQHLNPQATRRLRGLMAERAVAALIGDQAPFRAPGAAILAKPSLATA